MLRTQNVKHTMLAPLEQANPDSDSQTIQTREHEAKVFNMPEMLERIVKTLPPRALLNFAQVNRKAYYSTKPSLMHAGLRHSSSYALRRLADVVPAEKMMAKLQELRAELKFKGKKFIFECLLKGKQHSPEELKKQLSCLLPLKDQKLKEGTEGILTEADINTIVASVVPSKAQGTPVAKTPGEKLQALGEAGLLSAKQIKQLKDKGGDTAAKVDYLCEPEVILTLLQEPNPDLEAFAQISDDDINEDILELIQNLNLKKMKPEEFQRTTQLVEKMGKSKLFVNVCDKQGQSPLRRATALLKFMQRDPSQLSKQIQVIRTLLFDHGADPNQPDHEGTTALHQTALLGNIKVLNLLLDDGADPNQPDDKGRTAWHYAAQSRSEQTLNLLLDHGADPNQPDHKGMTVLHHAAHSRNIEVLNLLRKHGAKIDQPDHEGMTALHHAVQSKNIEGLQVLFDHGADPNQPDHKGMTVLHHAACQKSYLSDNNEILNLLRKHGAKIDQPDDKGMTALHYMAQQENYSGFLVLFKAFEKQVEGQVEGQKLIQELINRQNTDGESLMDLAQGPNTMIGKWLIQKSAEQLTTRLNVMHIA